MSKIKKTDLLSLLEEQAEMIVRLSSMIKMNKQSIIKLENEREQPKLKQLDQSVFDHKFVTDHFKYAALNSNGQSIFFSDKPKYDLELGIWYSTAGSTMPMLKGYDASNWQNSLIERDIAKELLEIDLSSELTGSDLCRKMLERGDKAVLCKAYDHEENDFYYDAITSCSDLHFDSCLTSWSYAVPINNQGEPLTAADVGL